MLLLTNALSYLKLREAMFVSISIRTTNPSLSRICTELLSDFTQQSCTRYLYIGAARVHLVRMLEFFLL